VLDEEFEPATTGNPDLFGTADEDRVVVQTGPDEIVELNWLPDNVLLVNVTRSLLRLR
jgi:hypothetical protein